MGKKDAYLRLTDLVEKMGRDWVAEEYLSRRCEGDTGRDIARSLCDIPWHVLYRWLEENAPEAIGLAKRASSELMVEDAVSEMRMAHEENIGVVKAQSDFALKIAGKWNRGAYGDSQTLTVEAGVSVLAALEMARGRVLEGSVSRMALESADEHGETDESADELYATTATYSDVDAVLVSPLSEII